MEIWSIIFYITSLASIIIPTIFCYKKFYKAEVGSCSRAASIFFSLNFLPSFGGSGGVVIDSFNTLLIIIWIVGITIGIGLAILNWGFLKFKKPESCHDDIAFNHSSGITSSYAFLYFAMYGTLILFIKDDEDFDFFELAYRKHAWIYYFVELIYFTGFFLSTSSVFFILKHDLNKYILISLIAMQSLLYAINLVIILDFKTSYILILVFVSLIEIGIGFFYWKNYYSDKEPIIIREEFKTTGLTNLNQQNKV